MAKVVITHLQRPEQEAIVADNLSDKDANALLERFVSLTWDKRRDHVYSIGDIIISVR